MKERVFRGIKCGILGYKNGSAIAWCSVAPKTSYRKLTDAIEADTDTTWSIVCFFIKREYQGQGIQEKMLEEAIKYARSNGAKRVEAYPVERDSPSYRFIRSAPTLSVKASFSLVWARPHAECPGTIALR